VKRSIAILFLCATTYMRAGSPPMIRAEDASLLLNHPRPEYPLNARIYRITGKGVFELRFDYDTGQMREIHIVKSTGHRSLDASVIATFKKWQAKPHSLRAIRVPIDFTISDAPPPR
jgi:TonB family protein